MDKKLASKSLILESIINEFKKLSKYPRPTFKLNNVKKYLQNFCHENKYIYNTDPYGNVLITTEDLVAVKKSSHVNVVIQSHMDMVCNKDDDSNHNFDKDEIQVIENINDYGEQIITSNKTTLGADNGIGLVSSLILVNNIKHLINPDYASLFLLITADKEEGLVGANNLGFENILPKNAFLINVDNEDKNTICIGCAGGLISKISCPSNDYCYSSFFIDNNNNDLSNLSITLKLSNFIGGHSGVDINKGHGNAIKFLSFILYKINKYLQIHKYNFKIPYIDCDNACNSIPQNISCALFIERTKHSTNDSFSYIQNDINKIIDDEIKFFNEIYNESIFSSLNFYEGNLSPLIHSSLQNEWDYAPLFDGSESSISGMALHNICHCIPLLNIIHNGVIDLETFDKSSVRTSTNIGTLKNIFEKNTFEIMIANRSTNVKSMEDYEEKLKMLCDQFHFKYDRITMFQGWKCDLKDNSIIELFEETHQKLFNFKPKKVSVHASLETGIILQKFPLWNAISIGPQINNAHSSKEEILVDSISDFYIWLFDSVLSLVKPSEKKIK